MKALQYFSDEYLERSRGMSADQVIQFLEDFRQLHGPKPARSRLISMKVPEDLLNAFKVKAALTRTPYQAQIKVLMKRWLLAPDAASDDRRTDPDKKRAEKDTV